MDEGILGFLLKHTSDSQHWQLWEAYKIEQCKIPLYARMIGWSFTHIKGNLYPHCQKPVIAGLPAHTVFSMAVYSCLVQDVCQS